MRRALAVGLGGVGLTLIALTFEAPPLLVLGIGLAALGVAAPAWVWVSARPVTVARRLHADRVIEGEPFEATIEIGRGLLGLPGAELRDPLASRPVVLNGPLSLIRGARSARVRLVTRFRRRGLHRLEPPSLIVRDALDLAAVTKRGAGPSQDLLVLPRTEPVRWSRREGGRPAAGAEGRSLADPMAAVDVDGLRPYRQGTPASRIHWSALARGAGLLERRLRADRDLRPLVVLDAHGAHGEELLDAAVRAAASLTLELARHRGCRLLLPGERRALEVEPNLINWPSAHVRLALVDCTPATRPPLLEAAGRIGPVFYVAAQPLERLPGAFPASARGTVVLVLPKELASATPDQTSLEVSGCVGFAIRARTRPLERAA